MTLSPNLQGALFMMGSMAGYTFNDALVKVAAADLPLFQVVLLRGILTTLMMFALAWAMGMRRVWIPRGDFWPVVWRTAAELAAMVAFLTALLHLPLANATAVLAALPLTVTLAGAVFLGEPVGWRRMAAILIGFVGVMLIIQPGTDGFNAYSLLAFLSVILITIRDIYTRQFSNDVPSLLVACITAFAVTVVGAVAMIGREWVDITPQSSFAIAGAAIFILAGYLFSIVVMRVGDIGFVAPFRYSSLIWALILGWFLLGEWPNVFTQIGALIVAGTGVYTLYREQMVVEKTA